MNKNITTFDSWAKLNKDKKMEEGHYPAVNFMLNLLKNKCNKKFDFIDIGCGNGWVLRKIIKYKNAGYLLGIDGAPNMIEKAQSFDTCSFINEDVEKFRFKRKFDIVFSMETFYYFKNIRKVIKNIYLNGMNDKATIIIGIDHYKENTPSLSWDNDYNLELNTLSISEWIGLFKNQKFKNIEHYIFNQKDNWHGTLVIMANK